MKTVFTTHAARLCFTNVKPEDVYAQATAEGAKPATTEALENIPHREQALSLLAKVGLPEPKKIAEGADDYLLFLKDIGCVVRLSTADTHHGDKIDLSQDFHRRLHPNMAAPIGWIKGADVTLYIYPGFLLEENNPLNKKRKKTGQLHKRTHDKFADQMKGDGFATNDYDDRNVGYYNTDHDQRSVIIDVGESEINSEIISPAECAKIYHTHKANTPHAGRAYERSAMTLCSDSNWSKSLLLHRELRDLFFGAFPGADENSGLPCPEKMKKFWDTAHEWTHNPKRRIVHEFIENPETGINTRITTGAYTAQLYRPWNGEKPPVNQNARLPLSSDPRNKLRHIGHGFKQNL